MKGELPPEHYREAEQAERALVGACILDPSQLDQVAELAGPTSFHDGDLGAAFGLLGDLQAAGKPIADPVVLVAELRKAGILERIGGAAFVAGAAGQSLAHNAAWYASQVRELAQRRELHRAYSRGIQQLESGNVNAAEAATRTEAAIQAAQHDASGELQTLDGMLADALAEVTAARERGQSLGLSTGIEILDRETGGFFAGELTILAARPSIGKTALAIELAARVARQQGKRARNVLFVSLEMSPAQLAHRFLCRETGIPARRIQRAELSRQEQEQLEQARQRLRPLGLKVHSCPRRNLASIRSRARVLAAQGDLDLLIIDYLGLIESESRQSLYERTTAISRGLKLLANELERPVLCLAQLNREAAKSGGVPSLEHLRDSGAIEQDADNVWLLHRETREATGAELIVAKQRQGAVGTIDLEFELQRMSFDIPKIRYAEWHG